MSENELVNFLGVALATARTISKTSEAKTKLTGT